MGLKLSKIGKFSIAKNSEYKGTLAGKIVPCVDQIRDLYTQFGLRPYTVKWVFTRWSGGDRDYGVEEVISEEYILPTPKITEMFFLDKINQAVGNVEDGQIKLTQISARFDEDKLVGRNADGEPIPHDHNFYYEIEYTGRDGNAPIKRRFIVSGVPELKPGKFGWTVNLRRAQEDRVRDGTPED